MFKKIKLNNNIKKCKKEIIEIEKKRYRSQANLVEAILTSKDPNDADVDYFNRYTQKIEELRVEIQEFEKEIGKL